MFRKSRLAIVLCLVLALPVVAAAGDDEGGTVSSNVLITITVDEGKGNPERTYRLVLRGDNSDSRLMTGWRVPIPSTTHRGQDDNMEAATSTSYTYQNVGLTAELRARVLSDKQVVLRGDIEVSAAKESTGIRAGAAPTIGTFNQRFNVLLDDGEPLELAQVANPEGGAVSIRVEASLMH